MEEEERRREGTSKVPLSAKISTKLRGSAAEMVEEMFGGSLRLLLGTDAPVLREGGMEGVFCLFYLKETAGNYFHHNHNHNHQ